MTPPASPAAPPRVAIVHDWLDTWRGGEAVLAELVAVWPGADLFALVDFLPDAQRARLAGKRASTSFLQRLPGARRHFRALLPLMPSAIERLDVTGYDLVISSSHAVAKGVRTQRGQLHLCYCHSPMRYAWDLRDTYLDVIGARGLRRRLAEALLDRLQRWDRDSAGRVDAFACNSEHVRQRIRRCYGRDATVIHPPCDESFFTPGGNAREGFYLTGSRFVPYKRIDLIAAAFRSLPERRLVVFGDGPERRRIEAVAGPNVELVGEVDRAAVRELMRRARAFVFAAEEDFGIVMAEAQACGLPLIALRKGGAGEIVVENGPGRTGVLFDAQSVAGIVGGVRHFEEVALSISEVDCAARGRSFSRPQFRRLIAEFAAQEQAKRP